MWKFIIAFYMDGAIILIIYLLFIRLLFAGLHNVAADYATQHFECRFLISMRQLIFFAIALLNYAIRLLL